MDNVVTEITGAETNFFATDLQGLHGSNLYVLLVIGRQTYRAQ